MKTKFKRNISIAFAITINVCVTAQQQVTEYEVRVAAIQAMNKQTTTMQRQTQSIQITESDIKRVNSVKDNAAHTLLYEVVFENGQAVILSGSKACLPEGLH